MWNLSTVATLLLILSFLPLGFFIFATFASARAVPVVPTTPIPIQNILVPAIFLFQELFHELGLDQIEPFPLPPRALPIGKVPVLPPQQPAHQSMKEGLEVRGPEVLGTTKHLITWVPCSISSPQARNSFSWRV